MPDETSDVGEAFDRVMVPFKPTPLNQYSMASRLDNSAAHPSRPTHAKPENSEANPLNEQANASEKRVSFYEKILRAIIEQTGAQSGIVWNAQEAPFQPVVADSLDGNPPQIKMNPGDHSELLQQVSDSRNSALHPIQNVEKRRQEFLLLGVIQLDIPCVIELVFKNTASSTIPSTDPQSLLRAFDASIAEVARLEVARAEAAMVEAASAEMAGDTKQIASSDQLTAPIQATSYKRATVAETIQYVRCVHRSIDRTETASNIANESRRLLDCDRASVVLKKNGKFRLASISGQPSVNRRSHTNRLMERLCGRVLPTEETFVYPSETPLPTRIRNVLDEFLLESATRNLVILPVFDKEDEHQEDPDRVESSKKHLIGGIVLEHCQEQLEIFADETNLETIHFHASSALRNATKHHGLFLYPVWNTLGKLKWLAAPKVFPKTLTFVAAAVALALALIFIKVDFYVTADGILMPKDYKPVFCPVDAKVDRILIQHGQMVGKGETLLVMTSDQHRFRVEEVNAQIESAEKRLTILEDSRYSKRDEEIDTEEQIVVLKSQMESLRTQKAILDKITEQMTVTSPITGKVITWDLKKKLDQRVVRSGEELLEVADVNGEWLLEIDLPIHRQGHLAKQMNQKQSQEGQSSLDITFLSATDPSKRYDGKLLSIDHSVSINSENEQVVKLRASISDEDIAIDQVRTGVTTKVYCGKSSLGYLWLHDLGEFANKNVIWWFR